MKTVMIVSGESSGELYGSLLAKALSSQWPGVRIVGIGGEKMRDAGVELLSGISSALGLTEVLSSMQRIRESLKRATQALREISPDVVVLIDYPDFNFRVARIAKKQGLKVLYYVSPQVWAWRKGRVKTMKAIADRVAVLLPFEEEIYRKAGIPCEFVGHPVMEEIEQFEAGPPVSPDPGINVQHAEVRTPRPVIALLPGSRPHELKTLLGIFIPLVGMIRKAFPDSRFILPLAPNIESGLFSRHITILEEEGVVVTRGDAIQALASSDIAVLASGTATLQAALLGVPMVVVYKLSPLTYFLGKAILDIRYISLVNILAGQGVVPELIQHRARAENIMDEVKRILSDEHYRSRMISSFRKIREVYSGKQPSRRVAEMIGEMAGWGSPQVKDTQGGR
jgi:lipid-A-disaccharide synthase